MLTQIPAPTRVYDAELTFTETYQRHRDAHPAIREIACLRVQFPALIQDIEPGDKFAGRLRYRNVGFGLEQASGGPGYYCDADALRAEIADRDLRDDERQQVEAMIDFWAREAMIEGRLIARLPLDVLEATSNPIADMGGRLAGPLLDVAKLARVGVPGLRAEIAEGRAHAARDGGEDSGAVALYDGMAGALDLLADICGEYARRARATAALPDTAPDWAAELRTIAAVLDTITTQPPATLREAMQLIWLTVLLSGAVNYGRLDVALGDFLAADLDAGRLDDGAALALVQSLWQLIADRQIWFNGRVILGGMGRPNPANADRFALLALEATRTVIETEPQLTLRFHDGQNPALLRKAYDVIGAGRTYPILYNDEVNVPAVAHAFGVTLDEAQHYLPYGCGEYALDHVSFGSPNCSLNLPKALEVTLTKGIDLQTGARLGLALGHFDDYATFDDLWAAYCQQVAHYVGYLAQRHALEYEVERETAAFLFVSMLYDDCIARGKSVVDGGARYLGGIIETFGIVNAANSLYALKHLVYDTQQLSKQQVLDALAANFAGHADVHRRLLDAPKFGNDIDAVDALVQRVSDHVAQVTRQQAARIGLDYFLVVNINNYANVQLGKLVAASADGRRDGEPLANGNTPTAGTDRAGVTAFLKSLAKIDPTCHAGYTQNMKFSPQMFGADRPKLEALLGTYFALGGAQAMITVVGRDDLENALREPEKYRNLIVRVGGFSARFVDLSRDVQMDLIKRTLY